MILAVGNVKGGVGKTTLSVNLAIALSRQKHEVLLIDGDEQGTAMAFTDLRTAEQGSPGYTAVALHGANLRTQARQLATKYADILIDVGGRDTGSLRAALTVADVVLIPVKPRSFDLWGVDQTAELVKEAREINDRLRAIVVLNEADPRAKTTRPLPTPYAKSRALSLPRCRSSGARRSPTRPLPDYPSSNTKTLRRATNCASLQTSYLYM
jgi:cellulose biosynthesis protein BcsQ